MDPRLRLSSRCPHGEYLQYYSGRGLLFGRYLCCHPDNEGCWCEEPPVKRIACEFLSDEEKALLIEVKGD